MNRRIAALALVALVALSGCAGFLNGSGPTTTTDGPGTNTTTTQARDFPPGIADGELTNTTALVRHHTDVLAEDGFVSSTNVVTRTPDDPAAPSTVIDYRATAESGGFPYHVDVNTTRGGEFVQERLIWGNESLRLERARGRTRSGNLSTGYSRKSGQELAVDPGIKAFLQVLEAGDFRVESDEGEGADRRITLVATGAEDEGLAAAGANVTDYSGELVVDGEGRIRRVDVTVHYVDRNDRSLVSEVSYRYLESADPTVSRPSWIQAALNGTSDVTITATAVDDTYIRIQNTGSEPITEEYRVVVATNQGAGVVDLNQSIAPGESMYLYQPKGGSPQLGYEEPTGELTPIKGEFRIALLDEDNDTVTDVVVSV